MFEIYQLHICLEIIYQDEAVVKVVEFMDSYSISQEDFDATVELCKFKVCLNVQNVLFFISFASTAHL